MGLDGSGFETVSETIPNGKTKTRQDKHRCGKTRQTRQDKTRTIDNRQ